LAGDFADPALPDVLASFFADVLAAFFEGAFAAGTPFSTPTLTFPTTIRDPIEGVIEDSSPPDHFTRNMPPVTPMTTPSRGS